MKKTSRKRLENFIERANYVETLSYLDNGESIAGLEAKFVDGQWQVEFYEPDDEKRDALLFNIRLFIQDKDEISLRRMTELYSDPGISDNWKVEHGVIRDELNRRLSETSAEGSRGRLSYREVLNMFLYGALGHKDSRDASQRLFEKWVTDQNEFEILHNTFHQVLIWVVAAVINVSRASKEEIARHPQSGSDE